MMNCTQITLSRTQWSIISIDLHFLGFIILFTITSAVKFSILIVVVGYGCPSSSRIVRRCIDSWALWNKSPNSASVTNAITFRNILHDACIGPFGGTWWSGTDLELK